MALGSIRDSVSDHDQATKMSIPNIERELNDLLSQDILCPMFSILFENLKILQRVYWVVVSAFINEKLSIF